MAKHLSRLIVCAWCDKNPAVITVRDEEGKTVRLICDECVHKEYESGECIIDKLPLARVMNGERRPA